MTAREAFPRVPALVDIGVALLQYAQMLLPPCTVELCGRRLVLRPNFAAFTPQPRRSTIRISLRGYRSEFTAMPELPLLWGRGGSYTECVIQSPDQLLAAVTYLHRAADIYMLRIGKRAA